MPKTDPQTTIEDFFIDDAISINGNKFKNIRYFKSFLNINLKLISDLLIIKDEEDMFRINICFKDNPSFEITCNAEELNELSQYLLSKNLESCYSKEFAEVEQISMVFNS